MTQPLPGSFSPESPGRGVHAEPCSRQGLGVRVHGACPEPTGAAQGSQQPMVPQCVREKPYLRLHVVGFFNLQTLGRGDFKFAESSPMYILSSLPNMSRFVPSMDQHCYLIHSGLGVKKGSGATKAPEFCCGHCLGLGHRRRKQPNSSWGSQERGDSTEKERRTDGPTAASGGPLCPLASLALAPAPCLWD